MNQNVVQLHSKPKPKKMIKILSTISSWGKPVIVDCAGGIASLSLTAFGVAGGLAHGMANNAEQFNSYPLRKSSEQGGGGGSSKWVYLPNIDKYVKASDLDNLGKMIETIATSELKLHRSREPKAHISSIMPIACGY